MKKLLLVTLILSSAASAHRVWVDAPFFLDENKPLAVSMGYGDFPVLEKISASRLHFFPPMEVMNDQGDVTVLKQQGENYQYVAEKPLAAGTYWATARYKPIFWSKNGEGKWAQQNMTEMKDAVYCEQTQMFGKSLVIVGGQENKTFIQHPIGHDLEIVPLADMHELKAGELFPVQIFFEGEPLADATVVATSDTLIAKDVQASLDHREPQGFMGKTDKKGRVNFIPLVDGLWKLEVTHKAPFEDAKVCQYHAAYATLIVPVGTERAEVKHDGHSH